MKSKIPMYYNASDIIIEQAKKLKANETPAEALLWQRLKANKMNLKFRRQHPIHRFIVDFYCHKAKLVIELDGGYHEQPEMQTHDKDRTLELENMGLYVLRFSNEEVFINMNYVIKTIEMSIEECLKIKTQ
jgi:very-short-patch-repair endonuclease